MRILFVIIWLIMFMMANNSFAQSQISGDVGKQVLEKLTQIEMRLVRVEERIDGLDSRMDGLDKRMDRLDKRIDDVRGELKSDIDDLRGLVLVILAGMISLVGFVLWDRRTAIAPVVRVTKELEGDRDTAWKVLREYAMKEPRFAEVLRTIGVL